MDNDLIFDISAVSFCAFLFLLYHIYFWCLAYCRPGLSTLRFAMEVRRRYIIKIQTHSGLELLGVQAMRNLIMGSSLMATLSFMMSVGLITFASNNDCGVSGMFCIKIIVLAIVVVCAGMLFIWATRAMVHASILISLRPSDFETPLAESIKPPTQKLASDDEEDIEEGLHSDSTEESHDHHADSGEELKTKSSKRELRRQHREEKKQRQKQKIYARVTNSAGRFVSHFTLYFHLGMRTYYMVVPLMLWLLSPWAMLGGTGVAILVMFFHDHETSLPDPVALVHHIY